MSPRTSAEPADARSALPGPLRAFRGGQRITSQQSLAWQADMQSRAALMAQLQPRSPSPGSAPLPAPGKSSGGAA